MNTHATATTTVADYRNTVDQIDNAIVGLAARINATTYDLLMLVREFDERGGWLRHGFSHCAEWLSFRCDLGAGAAREKVRVAHALRDLPEMSAAFSKGALSYSKVRALTRVATAANERSLIDFARTTTVARVDERCRQLRNVQPVAVDDANRVHANRGLWIRRNIEKGLVTITVEVPVEDGELIDRALTKAMTTHAADTPEVAGESFHVQQADALVHLARESLQGRPQGGSGSADAYQVVVHVDKTALTNDEGRSDLPVETVKRLSCDSSVLSMLHDGNGDPMSVGRKQRTIPLAINRALNARDRGCRFPGCRCSRFLHAHHVMHWAQGGSTSLDNLLLLCPRHHRLVHEGRYRIRKNRQGQWYFQRPDGRAVPECGYRLDDMMDEDIGDVYAEKVSRAAANRWISERVSAVD